MAEETVEIISVKDLDAPGEVDVIQNDCVNSTGVKTLRLALNLLTNALLFVTLFVCLVYICRPSLTTLNLQMILAVVGYLLFLCQGVMAISPCNGWTVLLNTDQRFHAQWALQFLGMAALVAGCVLHLLELKPESYFATIPRGVGIIAAAASILTFLTGLISYTVYKVSENAKVKFGFKLLHAIIAVLNLIVAAVSLGFAFEDAQFKLWMSLWFNNDVMPVPMLQVFVGIFTILIAVDVLIPEELLKKK